MRSPWERKNVGSFLLMLVVGVADWTAQGAARASENSFAMILTLTLRRHNLFSTHIFLFLLHTTRWCVLWSYQQGRVTESCRSTC